MSVLTHKALRDALGPEPGDAGEQFVITPLLEQGQIGPASIDVRLGPDIIVLRKSVVAGLDLTDEASREGLFKYARTIHVGYHGTFVLHPGEFVLGATIEYLKVPANLFCSVEGRSSLGRAGLVIATATSVQPGFKGCITLEIENLGPVPITLFPGLRIAQLVVHEATASKKYDGQFDSPTGPEVGGFRASADFEFFGKPRTRA